MTLIAIMFSALSNLASNIEIHARRVKEYAANKYLEFGILRGFPLPCNLTDVEIQSETLYGDVPHFEGPITDEMKRINPLLH